MILKGIYITSKSEARSVGDGGGGGDGVFKARNGEMRISENYLEIIHIFLLLVFLPTTL